MTPFSSPTAWVVSGLVGLLVGCARPPAPQDPPAPLPFATQLAAVRDGTATAIIVRDRSLDDDEWEALRGLAGLRELVLEQGVADDAKGEILGSLGDLERLVLRRSPLGDEGLAALVRCSRLRAINLPASTATSTGVAALASLPDLRSLRLGGRGLAGVEAATAVATLEGLVSLHLIDVPIGDEGLAALGRLRRLQTLYLDGAGVSDAAWDGYFHDHPDVHVHVDQAHHDRDPRGDHHATPEERSP